jgi:imidazole glycerol-phosphate synthase subunit HisH
MSPLPERSAPAGSASSHASPPRVTLFDYGAGNLHSLAKGLEAGGARVTITPDWDQALGGQALILPGVGSFGAAVRALEGHAERVREALEAGLPCLGICLGMQLLFDGSEEGAGRGIGLISGTVRRLRAPVVPQMGWNDVEPTPGHEDDPLFRGLVLGGAEGGAQGGARGRAEGDAMAPGAPGLTAYYANSFICEPQDPSRILATSSYGEERLAAAVRRGRTWGVQFHPEKSSAQGLRLLRNFLDEVVS